MANITGSSNTAIGFGALHVNTADGNTATGFDALSYNTTGSGNTANGFEALKVNTTGVHNTAVGLSALTANIIGSNNTAVGSWVLRHNVGYANTAIGNVSLYSNTTGNYNTAIGESVLRTNTTGSNNTALGIGAGEGLDTGNDNIYIGMYVTPASGDESKTIRIGRTQSQTFIAGINGSTSTGGVAVYVNGSGQLGTVTSSSRYKEEIRDMDDASSGLLQLRPVTFYYKPKYTNGPRTLQYGLIAEEVAEVYPDLVVYDEKTGQPQTVAYHLVNAMLLNEVQKQQRRINDLEERLAKLESIIGQ